MAIIQFGPVQDVAQLFQNVSDDAALARMFYYSQTQDLARTVGVRLTTRQREVHLIGAIRELLEADGVAVPECNCPGLGEGRRWVGADNEIPIRYSIDASVANVFDGAESYAHEGFAYVASLVNRLHLVPIQPGEVANIHVTAAPYDGQGNTLGVTSYYTSNDDDLDVFRSRRVAVNIVMDTAEFWTRDYFRTVFRHEVLHAVGLGHAPVSSDLMYAYYGGVKLDHPGAWTQQEMDLRYLSQRLA